MRDCRGFTLVETLMSLFLIGIGVLAVAPMFMYAMQGNATSQQFGSAGAIAVERMELLRAVDYLNLVPGGSLTADDAGYSATDDPAYTVRWTIVDNGGVVPGTRIITLDVTATNQIIGNNKSVRLVSLRGR